MILALFYERSLGYLGRRDKVMNNKDISVKLSDTIERQDFKRAIDAVQTLRPIDIADIIALIKPKLAWQLLEQLPNRSTIFVYINTDIQGTLASVFPRAVFAVIS